MIRVLCVGDVVGEAGTACLRRLLPGLKQKYQADVTVVNGENASKYNCLTPENTTEIFTSGADVITTGNHVFRNPGLRTTLEETPMLLRPANWGRSGIPGSGVAIVDRARYRLAVVNLIGTTYMNPCDNPFYTMEELLKTLDTRLILLDFHAEATGEKRAMGFCFDGRISAMFGTHTHVQTADAQVLPKKTGYVTDVGMTGVCDSVLGVKKEIIVPWMRDHLPARFTLAEGPCALSGAIFTLDEKSGTCEKAETFRAEESAAR